LRLECDETQWTLRLDGDCSLASAAELKTLLLEGLASGSELRVDLKGMEEIDITVLQLLWAAQCAAARDQRGFVSRVPDRVAALARNAGFDDFPGQAGEILDAAKALDAKG
jgi:ABC-type transporter Mla MlaB component